MGSDMLLATESSIKQRDNIKHFSFKPGNLRLQPQQSSANNKGSLIMNSSKYSQRSSNAHNSGSRENQHPSVLAPTTNPTPRSLLQQSAAQIKKAIMS